MTTLVSGSPIIKSIRIDKLAYQGECHRLLLGGSILIEHSTKCQGREAHLLRNGVLFRTASSSAQLPTLYSFAVQALPLGALHSARLLTSHRGAICAHSLTSKLADSFRLIMCSQPHRRLRHIHREHVKCGSNAHGEGILTAKLNKKVVPYVTPQRSALCKGQQFLCEIIQFYVLFCFYYNTLLSLR